MGKVDKQMLIKFGDDQEVKYMFKQNWPQGSKFLKLVALPMGIFAYFLVPDTLLENADGTLMSEEYTFIVAGPEISPDANDEFIDIVSVITEVPEEELKASKLPSDYQAVIIFPIFMRKERKSMIIT